MYTFLFIILPIVIALTPIYIVFERLRIEAEDKAAKDRLQQLKIAELEQKRQAAAALMEAKLAKEQNAIVLQDIKIETEKLKQRQLEQKLGMTSQEFNPQNYE